jgi:Na+/proline symporter
LQGFTTIDLIVVLVYLVGIAGLGLFQAVRIKSSGDYFAGGRKFNKWLMMMHALGTGTHADDPVGVTGASFQWGLSGIWWTFCYLFATPFYWIIAPLFRRSRYLTTADFFEARFSRGLAILYTIMGLLTFSVSTGMMLRATATLGQSVTGQPIADWIAILGMTAVFVSYGFAGGLIATVVTESIQGLLIIVMSLLLIPYGLVRIGGLAGLHALVPAEKFSLHALEETTLVFIVVSSLVALVGIVGQPHVMEVCSTGKTEWEGRVGFTYGNFIKRFCAMGWAFTGLIVLAMIAGGHLPADAVVKREQAFGVAIRELLPPGATGLMFAAILAAQMSTLSAFMVAGSALFSRNLYKRYWKPEATDEQLLRMGRYGGLLVVALGVGFALLFKQVVEGLAAFLTLGTLMGLFLWFGVLWRRTNATGVWVSFAVMAPIWLVLGSAGAKFNTLLFPDPANPGQGLISWLGLFGKSADMPSLALAYLGPGVLALIVGSLFGRPRDPQVLDQFYRLIRTPVGREHELTAAGVDVVYAGASEGHPWELNHPRLVNWGGFLAGLAFSLAILGLLYLLAQWGA